MEGGLITELIKDKRHSQSLARVAGEEKRRDGQRMLGSSAGLPVPL